MHVHVIDSYKWKIELMCTDLMAKEATCGQLSAPECGALDFLSKKWITWWTVWLRVRGLSFKPLCFHLGKLEDQRM